MFTYCDFKWLHFLIVLGCLADRMIGRLVGPLNEGLLFHLTQKNMYVKNRGTLFKTGQFNLCPQHERYELSGKSNLKLLASTLVLKKTLVLSIYNDSPGQLRGAANIE